MNIRGLTPAVDFGGVSVQFELRPRHVLAWQSIDELDAAQVCWLLADAPELLAWSVIKAGGPSVAEMIRIPSLQAALGSLTADTCSPKASEDCEPKLVVRLNDKLKVRFQDSLSHCDVPGKRTDETSRLWSRLLSESFAGLEESRETAQPSIGEQACGLPVCSSVWLVLAKALNSREEPASIRRPVQVERAKVQRSTASGESFQSQLHAAKMASMKQLAYGASHEINNPLANIASRAQTLLADETDPGRRLKLAKINEQAFRANEMIADMMLFAHPPAPEFALTDPADVIRQVIGEMKPFADRQHTRLRLLERGVECGGMDGTQLAVAVKALIQNCLESLQGEGTVEVELSNPDQKSLAVVVLDDGPGISDEALPHLFDPFYSGREAGRGLGFGLSKAWRIAELHGGEISADSPAHGGARFCLRIPYSEVA